MFLKYSICIMEKLASFYTCKDTIKEALNYAKEIISNYLGDAILLVLSEILENLGQSLASFYKRITVLSKAFNSQKRDIKRKNMKVRAES